MKINIAIFFTLAVISTGCSHKSNLPTSGTDIKPVIPLASSTAANKPTTSAPAKAAGTKTPMTTMMDVFTCARDGDVREIYTEPISPSGCKLWYSNKKTDPTAWSSKGAGHCLDVGLRIRKNLEGAGFKCAPVAGANAK